MGIAKREKGRPSLTKENEQFTPSCESLLISSRLECSQGNWFITFPHGFRLPENLNLKTSLLTQQYRLEEKENSAVFTLKYNYTKKLK